MKTIHKYELELADFQQVDMPHGAILMTVIIQHGKLCLWAEVQTCNPMRGRIIEIVGTGNPIASKQTGYIGTVVDGAFVWHVFEKLS